MKRVLIVDDQPIVVGVLRAFFAQFQHGHTYELTTASSANDAFMLLHYAASVALTALQVIAR